MKLAWGEAVFGSAIRRGDCSQSFGVTRMPSDHFEVRTPKVQTGPLAGMLRLAVIAGPTGLSGV